MISEGTRNLFNNIRGRLKAGREAWYTANMRFFRMGIEQVTLVTAEFETGDGVYLVMMPEKFDRKNPKQVLSAKDIHPKSVFLEFQRASDVDDIMKSLRRVQLVLQHQEAKDA